MALIFLRYFTYWYGAGLKKLFLYFKSWILILADNFSVKTSIVTFFSPWKRDVLILRGLPLDQKVRAIIFNIVSRLFGAFIKTFTLSIFLVAFFVLLLVDLLLFIIWVTAPAMPLVAAFFIIRFFL